MLRRCLRNKEDKNINIGNRKKLINGNGFVFGVLGSGKSFFCKAAMGQVFLSTDDEIIIIDPQNEYFDIAATYGGTVINMSTYTDNYVNPLAMDVWNLDQNDTKGCVRKMYIDIARSREKYIPVMSDFYDILMAQPEEEAKDIALSLELFVNGSLNIFNHQTNVDVDNRFTVYGIRDLGTELSPITMLANSEFVALLKQANTDSSKMAEVIGVSDAQLRFVTNNQSGMGLLKCGNVVIPFDNQIRKDTSLYKLYNTNLHEKISEMKEKEKQKNS